MDLVTIAETMGEGRLAAAMGLLTGLVFGVAAQRSRFCLRAATVEFARARMGGAVAVWLLTFSTALVWVQGGRLLGYIDGTEARMMAVPGSWSGAIIGGLLFGSGMVLARGCSGRLLVLAATGNLRSLVSGMVFAVVAQMSLHGALAPVRNTIASAWTTGGGRNLNLLDALHLPDAGGLVLGLILAGFAIHIARRNQIGAGRLVFGAGVGFAVALGWALTTALSRVSFDPIAITSATFSGPSANMLMYLLESGDVLNFDIGLIPGVVIGALASSLLHREFQFQGFDGEATMRRALTGAAMMGFGAMLAGGCAIGNGVTGTSIMAGTAWVALTAFWVGGMITDFLVDQRIARVSDL